MSLLSRLRRPSRSEFDREVLPHLDSLYATAVRLTRNERDAEDLVQDTVLRAFRFFHRFERGSNCRAWLFKILHNAFLTRYRKNAREREVLGELEDAPPEPAPLPRGAPDPEDALLARLLSDDVQRALDRLPEDFRAAVVLCDLEGFSYKEIADILDCPVGTVMSRLHRGRRALQESLRVHARSQGISRVAGDGASDEGAAVLPLRRRS